jgi:molecular chaperone DnaK (HSP70)
VGIDFGTTYSGVAYSRVGDVDGHGVPIMTEISKW